MDLLMPSGMGSHPPRLENFGYIGRHSYFLTFCTHERRPLLVEREIADLLRTQLLQCCTEHRIVVHAYCVMPDHVHLLAQGVSDNSDLQAFMRTFKQRTGWSYRQQHGARLWQGSYFDHVAHTGPVSP